MYLSETDVRRIFAVIAGRFPKATVFVETMNPMAAKRFREKSIEGSHAKFTWGDKKTVRRLPRCCRTFDSLKSTVWSRAWRCFSRSIGCSGSSLRFGIFPTKSLSLRAHKRMRRDKCVSRRILLSGSPTRERVPATVVVAKCAKAWYDRKKRRPTWEIITNRAQSLTGATS